MNTVVRAVPFGQQPTSGSDFHAPTRIRETRTPEIVIALCGPMGTPLHEVAQAFKAQLESTDFAYTQAVVIRLSSIIRRLAGLGGATGIDELIEAGNELRQRLGNEILVQHAIKQIYVDRQAHAAKPSAQTHTGDGDAPSAGVVVPSPVAKICHVIDSIKNQAELKLLRQVYGDMLHVVGVYTPIELRIERLSKRRPHVEVHRLIDRDSGEEIAHGQRVRDTFPQADFFLRADTGTDTQLASRVKRFLELMMGTRIITPTVAERAMYEAFSAARNSACLSRQVGAAIVDEGGELLGVGWNDVPRAFGGLYGDRVLRNADVDADHRCWNKDGGKCFNDEEKDSLASQVVERLQAIGVVDNDSKARTYDLIRRDSQLRDLIEFSRAVHAEMHALLNAGQAFGGRLRGGKLFVTTYPCHSCARHIVAAGIREVYFLEPYRKSLATKLHADSITETESDETKVRIMPFDGVAPSRFLRLFSSFEGGRKNSDGRMIMRHAAPVTAITMEAVQTLESLAIRGLE